MTNDIVFALSHFSIHTRNYDKKLTNKALELLEINAKQTSASTDARQLNRQLPDQLQ